MIFCLPAICAVNGWSANMILAIARNRHYSCCHCSVNVKLKELKYDLPYKKTVHRLAITLGLIVKLGNQIKVLYANGYFLIK